jgi:hypothetical protein
MIAYFLFPMIAISHDCSSHCREVSEDWYSKFIIFFNNRIELKVVFLQLGLWRYLIFIIAKKELKNINFFILFHKKVRLFICHYLIDVKTQIIILIILLTIL